MSDQSLSKPVTQKPNYDSPPLPLPPPSSRHGQALRFLTAATIGTILLVLSGLTLTGTVIALIIATPALVVFSPVLVPAGVVLFLATAGFLFSAFCALTALMALSWLYEYVAGKHPPGADQLDYARMRIANKARDMKERAKEYGQYVHHKAQEASS